MKECFSFSFVIIYIFLSADFTSNPEFTFPSHAYFFLVFFFSFLTCIWIWLFIISSLLYFFLRFVVSECTCESKLVSQCNRNRIPIENWSFNDKLLSINLKETQILSLETRTTQRQAVTQRNRGTTTATRQQSYKWLSRKYELDYALNVLTRSAFTISLARALKKICSLMERSRLTIYTKI